MHIKRIAGVVTAVAVVFTPLIAMALAEPTPDQHWVAVNDSVGNVDGNVRAVVAASDGSYYVAGGFDNVGRSYGNAVLANASTGLSESPFPDVDGEVFITISDQNGGWFIGGNFNRVGTLQRTGVAHILPDGTPDEDFDADVVFASGNIIYALATDGDNTLFVGGDLDTFPSDETTFSGVEAHGMIALSYTTGAPVIGYTQPNIQKLPTANSSTVYALAVDGLGAVYAGGDFTRVGSGTTRNRLVGFDAATGATTSFDGNANGIVYALAMDPASGDVYAGGDFTTVVVGRNRLALLDSTTGVATAFDPNMDNAVYTLAINAADPTTLYAGGAFTTVGMATTRNRLAAFDTGTSATTSWNPDVNGDAFSIALTSDGSTLYAVGPFTEVNVASGSGVTRDGVAAFRITDGDDIAGFSQSMQRDPYWISLNDDDTSVLIGSAVDDGDTAGDTQYQADEGSTFGGPAIIHILADGTRDPDFLAFANDTIFALALDEDGATLYAAGAFDSVNGNPPLYRNNIAAFDAVTGTETGFDPDVDGTVRALVLSSDGNALYAGGDFTAVNMGGIGQTRNHLAAFDTTEDLNNAIIFNPDIDDQVLALALSSDDATLYVGGIFVFVNGVTPRTAAAAFDTTTGTATDFIPDPGANVRALALSSDGITVYAGGDFITVNNNIGTITRNHAAAFDATTGVATDFDPDVDDTVQALAIGPDGIVYLGGEFDFVGGDAHEYIAAVGPEFGGTNSAFDSQLSGISDQVFALAHGGTDNGLLAGGVFNNSFNDPGGSEVPYVVVVGLAHYQDTATPTPTPATPTPTPESGGGSSGGSVGWTWPGAAPTPSATPPPTGLPTRGDPLHLARYGLTEGDTITGGGDDPDVYIVNEWGYKRLFLNPIIFSFYGHLGFELVKGIAPAGRDVFPTSGLFRNCEANDPKVYAVEVTGEDTGVLHHVQVPGDVAVSQDPDFFRKVFCINTREFNWYPKSPVPYTSLSQVPVYRR